MPSTKRAKAVSKFLVGATRHTVKETAPVHDALQHYLDEFIDANCTYLTAWTTFQKAGLNAAFEMQNAVMQASRSMFDATAQANGSFADQWTEALRQGQIASNKLAASTIRLLESSLVGERGE